MANSVSSKVKDGLEEGEIEDEVEDSRKAKPSSRSHNRVRSNSSNSKGRPSQSHSQRQPLRIPPVPRPNMKGVVVGGGSGNSNSNSGGGGWERTKELLKTALAESQSSENVARSPRVKPNSERHRGGERSSNNFASSSSVHKEQDFRDKMSLRHGSYSYPLPVRSLPRDNNNSSNRLGRYPWYRTKRYPSRTPVCVVRNSTLSKPSLRGPSNNSGSPTTNSFSGSTRPSGGNGGSSNSTRAICDKKKSSSSSHDDYSYEDLLLQYKSIQSQLEVLNREEAKSDHSFRLDVEDSLDKENFKGEGRRKSWRDDSSRFGKLDRFSLGAEALKTRRKQRNRNRLKNLPPDPIPISEPIASAKTQDEEDEMELRRIALASKVTRKRRLSVRNSQKSDSSAVPSGQEDSEMAALGISDEGAVQGCDNYEEVAMELDSNCGEDFVGDLGDDLGDEDELALRNHLLLTMKKRTQKLDTPSPTLSIDEMLTANGQKGETENCFDLNDEYRVVQENGVTISEDVKRDLVEVSSAVGLKDKDSLKLGLVVSVPQAPIHKRVVINLAEDSSDSEFDDNDSSPLLSTIDQLLKEARRSADTKQALLRLSGAQVQEYCRLKEEIAKREQVVTKPETKSYREEPMPQVSGQEEPAPQVSDQVPMAESHLSSKETTTSAKDCENRSDPQPPVRQTGSLLQGEKLSLTEISERANDEEELRLLRTALIKKRALLTASQLQVKRFQEQLAAAQKVVEAHQATVQKLNNQIVLVRKRLGRKTESHLQASNASVEIKNGPGIKRIKQTLNVRITPKQRVVRLKREVSAFTPQQLAKEKLRLQQLEQETLLKLQALRQTRGLGLQTAATKPVSDTKEVVTGSSSPVKKKLRIENDVTTPNSPAAVPAVAMNDNADAASSGSVNNVIETAESQSKQNACRLVESDEYTAITSSPFLMDSPLGESGWERQVSCNEVLSFSFNNLSNPLIHLRSYRLNKLSDSSVNSLTFAHKIDPNWTFCSFDLLGTCNDDQCPWQHLPRTK